MRNDYYLPSYGKARGRGLLAPFHKGRTFADAATKFKAHVNSAHRGEPDPRCPACKELKEKMK